MNVNKNWEGFTNLGHPNWTARTANRRSWADYEGVGSYAPNSSKIPLRAWLWSALVVVLFFAIFYIGAAVGF